jgi:predicted RecB family nuclease
MLDDIAHRYKSVAEVALSQGVPTGEIARAPIGGPCLFGDGPSLILDTSIEIGNFEFHFDAVKRSPRAHTAGTPHYEPVLFHHADAVPVAQQLLLAFGGYVLSQAQGWRPTTGIIVHGPESSRRSVSLTPKYPKVELIVAVLTAITTKDQQVPLLLNSHCGACVFQSRCLAEAKAQDNLTLLSRMTEKTVKQYARKGIFTTTQLSYTFHPRRQSKRAKARGRPRSFALQALAIREQKIYILAPPGLPSTQTRIFLDMEGTPDGSFVYLIGLLVQQGDKEQSYSFWADCREEETKVFELFVEVLSQFPNGHVFYYGPYEARVFKRMAQHFGSALSRRFDGQCTNVLSTLYAKVYFPTYSNSLKDVATALGYIWQAPTPSGLQTVVWRHQWEDTQDPALKAALLGYNRDDCQALRVVTDFMYDISRSGPSGSAPDFRPDVVALESLFGQGEKRNDTWGKKKSAVEDFESIIKSAYFEYQRAKVFLRTNSNFRDIHRRQKQRERRASVRVSKVAYCYARTCPFCNGRDLGLNEDRSQAKLSFDLRISRASISGVATRYRCHWYTCQRCGRFFLPRTYLHKQKLGHGLAAWAIHQHIANRVTFENLATTAREYFSLPIDFQRIHAFKARLAQFYVPTYNALLSKLVSGTLLHADETTINLQKTKGYVWVFTNMEEVVFVYRPDRNASFLHDLLRDFQGVLITDFFTGYDSLECPQQKCLVHLIRDLNDALLANPFEAGLRTICTEFGRLLRNIIATIDRFGLKTKYLRKHKLEVDGFFDKMLGQVFESDDARTLSKRMAKYRCELFTFLDYDGIPWNNNNAEHAIKHFAKYRRLVNGRVTQSGVEDYLKLLSLYVTCRYKEIGFLNFLLSRERDIDRFAAHK